MLQQEGAWNDFSPKLRDKLEQKLLSFGKSVTVKFDISNPDPDPEKKGTNAVIWPSMYTVRPVTFKIIDNDEDRPGKQKTKDVGMVLTTEVKGDRIVPKEFRRLKLEGTDRGEKRYKLDNYEDKEEFMYILLHPKLSGGDFADKEKRPMIKIVDAVAAAAEDKKIRTAKLKAMNVAGDMSDEEIITFADAMQWDSTEDITVLRNRVENEAEFNPVYFNELVESKNLEYQALVKQAMDRSIISFDPGEYKYIYTDNQQPITMLTPTGNKNHVEKLAEWFQIGGAKADECYKKIKGLVGDRKKQIAKA